MKKILAVCLCFVAIIALFSLRGCRETISKRNVIGLVQENYDEIKNACKNQDSEALLSIEGVQKVNVEDGYMIVFCEGRGISTSSQDYGFYYSEENSPIAVGCSLEIVCGAEDLSPMGRGYRCIVGGNEFYTEPIKDNLYFYRNAY